MAIKAGLAVAVLAGGVASALPGTTCDYLLKFDTLPLGMEWGGAFGQVPGDTIFIEDSVPVQVFPHSNGGFNSLRVEPAFAAFGSVQILNLNNIMAGFEFAPIGGAASVCFEYLDLGGTENLIVNGSPLYVGEISALPAVVAPGVTASVTSVGVPGGVMGTVTLTGNIARFGVAGQELWIDNVCVEALQPPDPCENLATFDLEPLGMSWGGAFGQLPGDTIMVEDDVRFRVVLHSNGLFNLAQIDPAFAIFGDVQVMEVNNIGLLVDAPALGPVEKVTFDFADGGGTCNLGVTGFAPYIGPMAGAPAFLAPGVSCTVTSVAVGGFDVGTVTVEGPIGALRIAGQELWIDNVCVEVRDCPADFDGDGMVGFSELLAVLSAFGPCGAVCPTDLDGNGSTDFGDVIIILSSWGACS